MLVHVRIQLPFGPSANVPPGRLLNAVPQKQLTGGALAPADTAADAPVMQWRDCQGSGPNTSEKKRRAPFLYPTSPIPRTAVLVPWFDMHVESLGSRITAAWRALYWASPGKPLGRNMGKANPLAQIRVFPRGWTEETERFAPASLAATFDQLVAITPHAATSLTHALIVLAGPDGPQLTHQRRDRLWQTFGLPVFEQIVDTSGRLLATECEMHQGLHIEGPDFRLPHRPVWGIVETSEGPCPCGRITPRVSLRIPQRLAAGSH